MTLSLKTKNPVNYITAGVLLVLCVVMILFLKSEFNQMQTKETVYFGKNENIVAIHKLSEWNENLQTTNSGAGDSLVYEIKGMDDEGNYVDGDTVVILGGVHANEPAGVVSATWIIENLHPKSGTVYVTMHANEAGFTCTDPQEASPMFFTIDTGAGERIFRYGSRVTNPIYQWPDPDIYVHSSGMKLAGSETRNLNRCYPGVEDGTISQQVAYAITNMVKTTDAAFEVDMHEASPEYKTINTTVYYSLGQNVAAAAAFNVPSDMESDSGKMGTDIAPETLRGLSHIELGTWTDTLSFLMETSNAAQGREHGKTGSNLVVTGMDKFYIRNQANVGLWDLTYGKDPTTGKTTTDQTTYIEVSDDNYVDSEGNSVTYFRALSQRCARHLTFVAALSQGYNEEFEKCIISLANAEQGENGKALTDEEKAAIFDSVGMGWSDITERYIYKDRAGYQQYEECVEKIAAKEAETGTTLTTEEKNEIFAEIGLVWDEATSSYAFSEDFVGYVNFGLDLTDNFYTDIRDNLYGDLAPEEGVLTSDSVWTIDNANFPVSITYSGTTQSIVSNSGEVLATN